MKTMALITNSRVDNMGGLVEHRSITTLPFGARYRLVDFALSNIVNSGIKKVGIFASDKYRSLIDHVGTGQEWSLSRKSQELNILQSGVQGKYANKTLVTLKDLKNNYSVFFRSYYQNVLFSVSNVVCNIGFKPAVTFHQQMRADVTLVCKRFNQDERQNGHGMLVKTDDSRRVKGFSDVDTAGFDYVFLEMMIVRCPVLNDLVQKGLEIRMHDIMDILKIDMQRLNIQVFEYSGYIRKIDSVKTYFNASMELLDTAVIKQLFSNERVIHTKIKDNHPTYYGINSRVSNSFVASGCRIDGDVDSSIIFRQNNIAEKSEIKNSILMEGCSVGKNVVLNYAILDKSVHINNDVVFQGTRNRPVVISRKVDI